MGPARARASREFTFSRSHPPRATCESCTRVELGVARSISAEQFRTTRVDNETSQFSSVSRTKQPTSTHTHFHQAICQAIKNMVADSYSDMSTSSTGDPSNLPPPCTSPMMGVEGGEDPFRSLSPHSSLFCSRKQREFTPDAKKDDSYWDRRRRNNAAAKRSREKRRINDMMLEKRVIQLSRENHILRAQVTAVFKSYGIRAETLVDMDQVLATLPSEDQILSVACGPSSSTRHAMSPPPLAATSITLPSAAPTRPEADLYQTFRARSPSNERPRPQCVILRERDEPLHGVSPAKRPAFMHHHAQAWEMEPRASSAGSNSENSEDALNLTTTSSRSRSSSEAEEDFHMHMPHKLRYKYGSGHLSPVSSSIKSEEDF